MSRKDYEFIRERSYEPKNDPAVDGSIASKNYSYLREYAPEKAEDALEL